VERASGQCGKLASSRLHVYVELMSVVAARLNCHGLSLQRQAAPARRHAVRDADAVAGTDREEHDMGEQRARDGPGPAVSRLFTTAGTRGPGTETVCNVFVLRLLDRA
jgi:hypothetical protein